MVYIPVLIISGSLFDFLRTRIPVKYNPWQNVTNNRKSQCWCQNQQAHCVCQVASQCQTSAQHKKCGYGEQHGVPKHVGACLNVILHRKLVQELTQCERIRTKEHQCAKQLLRADVSDPQIILRQIPHMFPHMFRNRPLNRSPLGVATGLRVHPVTHTHNVGRHVGKYLRGVDIVCEKSQCSKRREPLTLERSKSHPSSL